MRKQPRRLLRHRTLSAQLLTAQIVVLVLAGLVGFLLWGRTVRTDLDHRYEQRALAIAEATAAMPQVVHALVHADPRGVQSLASDVERNTGASYVVVIDRHGVRYSHPTPNLVGRRVEEPVVALDGHGHVRIDNGSLGPSANGRAPVFGPDGTPIGEVSAGVTETEVAGAARSELVSLAIYLAAGLAVGLVVAVLLARRLKRQTFGLELDEIAALVQEREATLYGIREGVVAIDPRGRLSLLNDQAHHLLGTTPADVGRPVADVVSHGDLRALMLGDPDEAGGTDRLVLHRGRFLVGSSRPVREGGRELGVVVTLRDRTELEHALRELDEVRRLTDALRAQQHEFANRMHVMSGLLEVGRIDEAMGYATAIDSATAGLAAELDAAIDDPRLVALLVAKTTVARERGIVLEVDCETPVHIESAMSDPLVTVVGNLVENGIDAASTVRPVDGVPSVAVRFARGDGELVIDVDDTGPGIPAEIAGSIFVEGWSTKAGNGRQRGLGLALVRQVLNTLGGDVVLREGGGARFRVTIPLTEAVPSS